MLDTSVALANHHLPPRLNGPLIKPKDANCARRTHPALGVKRLSLRSLFAGNGCAIDHSEPHRLHFHVAILVTGGVDHHMVDFEPVPLQANDLLLLRAGQVHAFGKHPTIEGEILTFTNEFLGTLEQSSSVREILDALFGVGPCIGFGGTSAAYVRKWYAEFADELATRTRPFAQPRIASAFGLLAYRLASLEEFRPHFEGSQTALPRLVREFQTLLENNFVQQREPAWYAARLNVSVRTLNRQLVRTLKHTGKELIKGRVLLEAKRLLADPDIQVKAVAYALCFDEVANFSRFFHQNMGLTPKDYKSNMPDWPH